MEDGGFFGGRGGEWQAVVAGIKDLRRFISTGFFSMEKSVFP